ncbi:FkbM family methyltransferase [Pseudomonas chlororaphis]
MIKKTIKVLDQSFALSGDPDYLGKMGEVFEKDTTDLLRALCDETSTAIDVGANIGLTSIALSQICQRGRIIAIEPVPNTFEFLKLNIDASDIENVSLKNVALGAAAGSVEMFVNDDNLAASFVVSSDIDQKHRIPLSTLDQIVSQSDLGAVDFIKIDVEGFELEVLKGAVETLASFRPIVLLEMNHWCLNIFQSTALPVFRHELLKNFEFVYAVDDGAFLDFSDPILAGEIYHSHVFENKYMHIVAGFDKADLVSRLEKITAKHASVDLEHHAVEVSCTQKHAVEVTESEEKLQLILNSTSWKITAPLRFVAHHIRSFLTK